MFIYGKGCSKVLLENSELDQSNVDLEKDTYFSFDKIIPEDECEVDWISVFDSSVKNLMTDLEVAIVNYMTPASGLYDSEELLPQKYPEFTFEFISLEEQEIEITYSKYVNGKLTECLIEQNDTLKFQHLKQRLEESLLLNEEPRGGWISEEQFSDEM
jgi:hypothetical protein